MPSSASPANRRSSRRPQRTGASRRATPAYSRASRSLTRTSSARPESGRPAVRACSTISSPRMTRPSSSGSLRRAPSCSERRTWTSSRWVRPTRPVTTAPCTIPGTTTPYRAAPRAVPRRPSQRGSFRARRAPTRAARYASPRRSRALRDSSRPTAGSPDTA